MNKIHIDNLPPLAKAAIYKIDEDDAAEFNFTVEELHILWSKNTAAEWLDEIKYAGKLTKEIEEELFPYLFGTNE